MNAKPTPSNCAAEVIDVLPRVMHAVRASMRRGAGALSVPQFRALGHVARHPGASVSDVAAFLGVTLATASALVDRLARGGYVEVGTAASDRRRSELRPSKAGAALLDQMRAGARRDIAASLAGASEAELAALLQGLAVLERCLRHD